MSLITKPAAVGIGAVRHAVRYLSYQLSPQAR